MKCLSVGVEDSLGFSGSYMKHEPTIQSVRYANGMIYWTAIGRICNVMYKYNLNDSLQKPPIMTHLGDGDYRMIFCPVDLDATALLQWRSNVLWGVKEDISQNYYEFGERRPKNMCGLVTWDGPIGRAFRWVGGNVYPPHVRQMFIQTANHDKVVSKRKIDRCLYTQPDPQQCIGMGHVTFCHPERETAKFYKKDALSIPENCLGRPYFAEHTLTV